MRTPCFARPLLGSIQFNSTLWCGSPCTAQGGLPSMLAPLPPGDDDVIATFLAPAPAPPTAVDAPPAPGNVTTARDDLALEDFLASPPVTGIVI